MAELGASRRTESWRSVADLSDKRYHIMRATGERTCNINSDPAVSFGAGIVGILENAPTSGHAASICVDGETKVVAGSAFAVNALLTSSASGRAVTAVSGQLIVGRARMAAAVDGDIVSCHVDVWRLSGAV